MVAAHIAGPASTAATIVPTAPAGKAVRSTVVAAVVAVVGSGRNVTIFSAPPAAMAQRPAVGWTTGVPRTRQYCLRHSRLFGCVTTPTTVRGRCRRLQYRNG